MDTILLNPEDNVVVALREITPGESVQAGSEEIRALDQIPSGHKIARFRISAGEVIRKYGIPVGRAVSAIEKGAHAHVHNVKSIYMDNERDHHE